MTVTIQLPSDIEAEPVAQARAQGLDLPKYVARVLREQVPCGRSAFWLTPISEFWNAATRPTIRVLHRTFNALVDLLPRRLSAQPVHDRLVATLFQCL